MRCAAAPEGPTSKSSRGQAGGCAHARPRASTLVYFHHTSNHSAAAVSCMLCLHTRGGGSTGQVRAAYTLQACLLFI